MKEVVVQRNALIFEYLRIVCRAALENYDVWI